MLGPCLIVEMKMAKKRDAAMFDLFDQAGAKSQIGERQSDLEDLIAFEDSLLAAIRDRDAAKEADWLARAESGEIMRIC